jgi:hypothetical protein
VVRAFRLIRVCIWGGLMYRGNTNILPVTNVGGTICIVRIRELGLGWGWG